MKNLAIAIMAVLGLSACSKYEEGPALSLSSKKARVANEWEFAKVTDDGRDITESYDAFRLTLTEDGDATLNAKYDWGDVSVEFETDGTWAFTRDKENLELDFEDDDADNEYQILRLTQDEMWLREVGDDRELQLESR